MSGFVGTARTRRIRCRKKRALILSHTRNTAQFSCPTPNPKFKHSNLAADPPGLPPPLAALFRPVIQDIVQMSHTKRDSLTRCWCGGGRAREGLRARGYLTAGINTLGGQQALRYWPRFKVTGKHQIQGVQQYLVCG